MTAVMDFTRHSIAVRRRLPMDWCPGSGETWDDVAVRLAEALRERGMRVRAIEAEPINICTVYLEFEVDVLGRDEGEARKELHVTLNGLIAEIEWEVYA